jgi:hypothetical protein
MTNGGASMPIYIGANDLPARHLVVVPAACLRHFRSLLRKRVRATSALRARGKRASAELDTAPNLSPRRCKLRGYAPRVRARSSRLAIGRSSSP